MKPMQVLNQRRANKRRRQPTKQVLRLRTAIQNAGLTPVGYEWLIYDTENKRPFWFDVCVNVNGQDCMIDLEPWLSDFGKDVMRGKIEYCLEHMIPLLILESDTMPDMWGQVEKWLRLQRRKEG